MFLWCLRVLVVRVARVYSCGTCVFNVEVRTPSVLVRALQELPQASKARDLRQYILLCDSIACVFQGRVAGRWGVRSLRHLPRGGVHGAEGSLLRRPAA